ncbi:hypothetical protein Acr_25g0009590 [Actinidia rufa]|uniref:Uncharacterized protein n=1 Tax=Actinidia rufa TaxID=165716 RepID=A0A7J0H0E1_9ERIC|nr:hypothetical protein Acr_25g0009590 [Actinidia rufa]
MEAQIPTNAELQKAWHLLSLLLRIALPLRPSDLASRCVIFKAPIDYVAYLCSIPNSPICLTGDLLITPSVVAFVAFRKFVSNLTEIDGLVPRVGLGVFQLKRSWEDDVRSYCRRRNRLRSEFESVTAPKL